MPMSGVASNTHALAYFPPTFLGNVAQKNKGKGMPIREVASSPQALAYFFFPILVWATWPSTEGEKYANACGCMQPHALADFFPQLSPATWPRQSRGKVCQCVRLCAATCSGILFPYFSRPHGPEQPHALAYLSPTFLGRVAQKKCGGGGKVCQCVWLHAAPRISMLFPYCYLGHVVQKSMGGNTYANVWGCI